MSSRCGSIACLAGAVTLAAGMLAGAEDATVDYKRLYEEQKGRSDSLERRVSILEEQATQDVYVAKEALPESTLAFLKQTEISGLVSASYLYNFNDPANHENAGRGFDDRADEFMLNKAALFLEKPLEYNAFDWSAGYAAKLLFGQDARLTQTDLNLGDDGDLFEANVVLNVPVGNGLKLLFGKCGTPMGYESSFTEQNYNWSGGLQWTFVEPFTHTGLKASYAFSPEWEAELYVFNGWDVVEDNNDAKSFMGHVTYTPREATTVSLIGYGGPEQDENTSNWRRGVDGYVQQKLVGDFTGVVQFDYGEEDGAAADGSSADWWAGGLWLIYEPSERWNLALRGDYLNDEDGARTSGSIGPVVTEEEASAGAATETLPQETGAELYSLTLTFNYKPVEALRIAPEVRWDHATLDDAFDGNPDQVTLGMGAAYLF
jgi:hypothetical protein